ncbi:hypothetical protein ZIOFF_057407 [Zingiber officinale]|uniref:Uncharacterized protein n=1 Tax=Zingiber officinale TaxID=94328 RepID=A0A8J5F4J2_ZINOF|nr:hypothetical protein ZIOFF_057407 [Zingiber officinale]
MDCHLPLNSSSRYQGMAIRHPCPTDRGLPIVCTVQAPAISEYVLGAELDLFKAPEILVEEPPLELDRTADVISVLSPGHATTETIKAAIQNANAAIAQMDEAVALEEHTEGSMQRSASSGCLCALEWFPNCTLGPDVLDFQGFDFETAFGLRRAFSEGDIQNLGNISTSQYACRKVLAENLPRVRGRFAKV